MNMATHENRQTRRSGRPKNEKVIQMILDFVLGVVLILSLGLAAFLIYITLRE
jgi:hypothetical protein